MNWAWGCTVQGNSGGRGTSGIRLLQGRSEFVGVIKGIKYFTDIPRLLRAGVRIAEQQGGVGIHVGKGMAAGLCYVLLAGRPLRAKKNPGF